MQTEPISKITNDKKDKAYVTQNITLGIIINKNENHPFQRTKIYQVKTGKVL